MTDTVRDHLTDLHLALCAADAAFKSVGQAAVKAVAVLPSNDRDIRAISDVEAMAGKFQSVFHFLDKRVWLRLLAEDEASRRSSTPPILPLADYRPSALPPMPNSTTDSTMVRLPGSRRGMRC